MSLETGKIYDGKVRNIAPYGAFVEVNLDGKVHTGMVHISEISNTYVNEIRDHLTEGQEVKVKVLNVDENGKISLSIKKASESPAPNPRTQRNNNQRVNNQRSFNGNGNNGFSKEGFTPANRQPVAEKPQTSESSFEEMLSKFKQSSEEKMSDLKRNMDGKRRNTKRIR